MKLPRPLFIAGPCAVESRGQMLFIAGQLRRLDISCLRGGVYKPRTDPNTFQGLGEEALAYLEEAKRMFGLMVVTEVLASDQLESMAKVANVFQIGARNMFNYELLKDIGRRYPHKPVLLKRSFSATKREVLGSIGYMRNHGHQAEVVICERGIRTFANGEYDRFTLDLAFVASFQKDRPPDCRVIVDPSHAAGHEAIVENLALAGIAAGADGFIIEVKQPETVPLVDAEQAISISQLESIMTKARKIQGGLS